jgi:ribonuclease J
MTKNTLLNIKPLGGVGQIGSNMVVVKSKSDCFIIDIGILFPYEDFFDINYLIPDLDKIDSNPTKLIITHGHEDHIGAIVHIIKHFPDIEVHAPEFATALIRGKLDRNKISHKINIYRDIDFIKMSQLEIHPIRVNHSIPDTFGILIKDIENTYSTFYISDFKIDELTPYEKSFDFEKLKRLTSEHKTRLLMADSTNITSRNEETPSESLIIPEMEDIFSSTDKRVFITLFSSNIHRIQTIINAAKKYNRKVIPYGRSVNSYINTATEIGILENTEGVIKSAESYSDKEEKIIVLLTGCQGDFRGTMRRVSNGDDSRFKPRSTDTFIFSSKPIPGNEKKINMLINKLYEQHVKVITANDRLVHVSGHAGKLDLIRLYNEMQPTHIIPIHGETSFLHEHFNFINNNYKSAQALLAYNYTSIDITKDLDVAMVNEEVHPPILIHGDYKIIEREAISQRRKLACNGSIFISINTDTLQRAKVKFTIDYLGLPKLIDAHTEDFNELLNIELKSRKIKLLERTADEIRIFTRRFFNEKLGYKPITIVHFV